MPLPRSIAGVLLPAMAGLVLSTALTVAQEAASTVEALLDAGRYAEAEVEAARALDRASAADIDSASGRLLDVLLRNGRGTDTRARELAERLVSAHRSPGSRGRLATSLRRLGEVQYQSAEYARAVVSIREAVAMREKESEPDLSQLAADLEQLVEVLTDEIPRDPKTLDEALALAERALSIRQGIGEEVGTAHALRARGAVWQSKSDYTRARADFEQSLAFYEQRQPWHPETAVALQRVGEQYWFEGRVAKADETMSRACAMSEGTLRPGHPEIASCLRLQAVARKKSATLPELGRFENAGSLSPKRRSEASIHVSRSSSTISRTATRAWVNFRPPARCMRGPARHMPVGSVPTITVRQPHDSTSRCSTASSATLWKRAAGCSRQ